MPRITSIALLAGLLTVVALAVVVGAVAWALSSSRKRGSRQAEALGALGFRAMDSPPAALADGLMALQPHREAVPPALRNLFQRTTGAGELYLFDVDSDGEGRRHWLGSGTFAVVIPGLAAPGIVLLPSAPSKAGKLMTAAMTRALDLFAATSGMARIPYPDDIEFDERFVVLSNDEEAVRQFLTAARRAALLELPPSVAVSAAADLVALSAYPPQAVRAPASIQELSDAAERLLVAMSERPNPDNGT